MAPARKKQSRTAPWRWTGQTGRTRTRRSSAPLLTATAATADPPASDPHLSRDPTPAEQHVNWAAMDAAWLAARAALVKAWQPIRDQQIQTLARQVQHARSLEDMLNVSVPGQGGKLIERELHRLADFGAEAVTAEAAAQGHALAAADLAPVKTALSERATVVAESLAKALSEAAGREAVMNAGGVLTATEVASEVADHLGGLSNAFLEEQLGGAAQAGLNGGRFAAMEQAPGATRYQASSLLDGNVCINCAATDGREWTRLEEARQVFPVAGNRDCLGRLRCRCTLVAILPSETLASVA